MAKGLTRSIEREILYEALKGFARGRGRDDGVVAVCGVYGNDMPAVVDVGEWESDGACEIVDNAVEERL